MTAPSTRQQPGVVIEPRQEFNWSDESLEILDTAGNWIARHPWTTALLSFTAFRMIQGGIKAIKNRKGSNLFIEIDFTKTALKKDPLDSFEKWMEPRNLYYRDLIETLDLAAKDSSVAGIIVRIGDMSHLGGLSTIWQFRECIKRFREAGKKTIAFSESFGETGENLFVYYMISGFEEIHIPRSVFIPINGRLFSGNFINKLLEEKLDIHVQFLAREKYKNFANMYTEEKFTPEHREHVERLQRELLNMITNDIAEDRGISREQLDKLIDEGFHKAADAKSVNIITHVGHRDSAYQSAVAHTQVEKELNLMYAEVYNKRFNKKYKTLKNMLPWTKRIAVVHLSGPILSGSDKEKNRILSDDVAKTLRAARKDKLIHAVIIQVNSPGGSVYASDTIFREIQLLKESGVKVVVFQADVAASGGYWISLPADKVIATPFTLTGSIGVVFGKLNISGMWKKIGITFDHAEKIHNRQDFFSTLQSWDDKELGEANKLTDNFYDEFKDMVAEQRKLTRGEVDELAQGKVYTGKEALALKLVDQLGTFTTAVEAAKELLGLKKDDYAQVVNFPPTPTIGKMIVRSLLSGSDEKRNSRDEDEARRRGMSTQSVVSLVYQSTGISAYMRRMGAMLRGDISLGELHHEVNALCASAGARSQGIEAYSFDTSM